MNDRSHVEQLLQEHGCKLIREGNHLIYRLPNGRNFVMSKSPSDFRSERNNLAILRRYLNLRERHEPKVQQVHGKVTVVEHPPQEEFQPTQLELTLASQIAAERARYDFLLDEAAKVERKIALLEVVSAFANDEETEQALRDVLGEQSPVFTPSAPLQLHSGPVTERVQVTSPLVLAATHTFDEPFTLNSLVARMVGEKYGSLDPDEQRRIRSSITSAIQRLESRGEVKKSKMGVGKIPALYEKVGGSSGRAEFQGSGG